jgi:futalosine hydrolase
LILVCAATAGELATYPDEAQGTLRLVTGVGIPATFAGLIPSLEGRSASLLLNIGIAGAYPGSGIGIGDIVLANGEIFGDVGFELPEAPRFRPVSDSGFGREFYAEPLPTVCPAAFSGTAPPGYRLHVTRGCTVNACAGTGATGEHRARLFGAGFETMEGAAVAQIGRMYEIPVCEVRAVSNIAARRDMRPENIRLALANLAKYLETCGRDVGVQSDV